MTEQFITGYIPQRMQQLGFSRYYLNYHDMTVKGNSSSELYAYNQLWFVVDDPVGLLIESDYGIYDSTGTYISNSVHEHRGEIIITNPDAGDKKIKMIQVIII